MPENVACRYDFDIIAFGERDDFPRVLRRHHLFAGKRRKGGKCVIPFKIQIQIVDAQFRQIHNMLFQPFFAVFYIDLGIADLRPAVGGHRLVLDIQAGQVCAELFYQHIQNNGAI